METHEAELVRTLAELADLLEQYGEPRWAAHFRQCWNDLRFLIQKGAPRAEKAVVAARIRSAYGGMGSFRDLVIHPLNGHPVEESMVDAANAILNDLSDRLYHRSFLYQEAKTSSDQCDDG